MTQQSEAAMPADPLRIVGRLLDGYGPQQAISLAEVDAELAELEDELARSLVASNPGRTYDQALAWLRGPGPEAWLEEHGY